MIEILQNTQHTLSVTFSAGDADANVTCLVKDQDGATVTSGTATHASVGRYTFQLPPQTQPMWLVVTWSGSWGGVAQSIATGAGEPDGTSGEVQVAGGHLFTVAELRAFAGSTLSSTSTYPDETLINARSLVTALMEQWCDVAFVTRYGRATMDGNWEPSVWLPNTKVTRIRSVVLNGTALAGADLAAVTSNPDGKVWRNGYYGFWDGTAPQNVTIGYEHGYTYAPPDLAVAGLTLTHYLVTHDVLADRTISTMNEFGIIRQAQPDDEHPTGIPFVDATLCRYSERSSAH